MKGIRLIFVGILNTRRFITSIHTHTRMRYYSRILGMLGNHSNKPLSGHLKRIYKIYKSVYFCFRQQWLIVLIIQEKNYRSIILVVLYNELKTYLVLLYGFQIVK